MPTLRSLECFVAVVESGSVTAASVRLHLSQPALSHQLASLEREVGTALVERLPRGVRPTPAGRAILADARASLAAADRAVRAGRAVAQGAESTVHVMCAESMTVPILAPILRRWSRYRPEIRFVLTETASADAMAAALEAGDADIAIGPRSDLFGGQVADIGMEEIVAVLPPGHSAGVQWAALADEPIVHYHRSNGLGEWLDSVAAEHNSTLDAVTRTRQAATAAQLAHAGLGVALVPTTALPSTFTGTVQPLEPRLYRTVVAMVGSPSDEAVQQFTADLVERGIPVPASIRAQL